MIFRLKLILAINQGIRIRLQMCLKRLTHSSKKVLILGNLGTLLINHRIRLLFNSSKLNSCRSKWGLLVIESMECKLHKWQSQSRTIQLRCTSMINSKQQGVNKWRHTMWTLTKVRICHQHVVCNYWQHLIGCQMHKDRAGFITQGEFRVELESSNLHNKVKEL